MNAVPLEPSVCLCHLCQTELGDEYDVTPNGMLWCLDGIACKFRARRNLGVGFEQNLALRERDIAESVAFLGGLHRLDAGDGLP